MDYFEFRILKNFVYFLEISVYIPIIFYRTEYRNKILFIVRLVPRIPAVILFEETSGDNLYILLIASVSYRNTEYKRAE